MASFASVQTIASFASGPPAKKNFLYMSIGFSSVHGMCTTPLIYATTLLGSHDGDVANGTLYVMNVVSSLLLSVLVVRATGLKGGLLLCMSLYALYVGFFAAVLFFEDALHAERRWYAVIPSSVCGGLAFAIGWTAQGGFFARSATLISQAEARPRERVNVELAGTFALCYLLFELMGKAGFSFLQRVALLQPVVIFGGYCLLAVVVTAVMAAVLERLDASATSERSCARKLCDTVVLWRHPRLWLLSPTNFAFGFAAAYMNGHINSLLAKLCGAGTVGIMSALTTGTSACLVQLYGPLSLSLGKSTVLGLGALSFFSIPLITLLVIGGSPDSIHILVVLYVLQGSGRAVYESTNKAIISDAFQGIYAESAFANSFVQLSLAASACFFLSDLWGSTDYISTLLMLLSVLMLPCYKLVQMVTRIRAQRRQLDPATGSEVEMGDSFLHC